MIKKTGLAKITYAAGLLSLLALPFVVTAQGGITPEEPPPEIDIPVIVNRVIGWMFALLLVIAAVFILVAAFSYLTAAGDEEKVKKAKNYIIYAVVAIAIAFAARGIIAIVEALLRG